MDLRKIKKLIELVEESAIEELEVANGDESIRIVLPRGVPADRRQSAVVTPSTTELAPDAGLGAQQTVNAPMAGTFYRASHPEAAPFVELGSAVQAGEVVCIIESMKMMHEIRAASDGVVTEICVDNAQAIGTGEVLFKLS